MARQVQSVVQMADSEDYSAAGTTGISASSVMVAAGGDKLGVVTTCVAGH